jgi:hypothetical protein
MKLARAALLAGAVASSVGACSRGEATIGEADKGTASEKSGAGAAVGGDSVERPSGNPADRPGVKVYRPEQLTNVRYDRETDTIVNLDTGDSLKVTPPFRESPGHYVFSNEKTGDIAFGGYLSGTGGSLDREVFEITSVHPFDMPAGVTGQWFLARAEFDVSPIAELFRARLDATSPNHRRNVLVVDVRPETPAEIDRQTGSRGNAGIR